jgi:hypothetical protein
MSYPAAWAFFENFLAQVKIRDHDLPAAAVFLAVRVKNMADTYSFLPNAVILILSLLRKVTNFAAFGPRLRLPLFLCRLRLFLPDSNKAGAGIFSASPHTSP